MSWVECCVDSDYEICDQFPHQIRKKSTQRIVKEFVDEGCGGYVRCCLNCKKYLKHRVIAMQFIPNPESLPEVDHINRIRQDNRIENIRWISKSNNERNKAAYNKVAVEYLDQLPEDCIPISIYKGIEFENYYYSKVTEKCYYDNGVNVRTLPYHTSAYGMKFIRATDVGHVSRCIYIQAWLREECII